MTSGAVLFTEAAFSIYNSFENKRHDAPETLNEDPYSMLRMTVIGFYQQKDRKVNNRIERLEIPNTKNSPHHSGPINTGSDRQNPGPCFDYPK